MTFKDISKKFDEEFGVGHWPSGHEWNTTPEPDKVLSFLRSTLDEYVRELIGEEEDCGCGRHPNDCTDPEVRSSNQLRQEILKQHEENIK